MSGIGASLFSLGIPKDSILSYELALKTDKFLVLANGTAEEAARARDILKTTHPSGLNLHSLQLAVTDDREHATTVA